MANVIIDVAAEFTGKKAFSDAGKATTSLEKGIKTLGKTIGLTFSAKAIVDFSKASVKAFAEDDRAIRVLRTNLKNLGLAYQSANADNFIATMEKQAAISDDLLRPAYAQLAKITLSTTKTQDLMALAFDVSAANGIDFASTVDILANAYVGNYKGLKQLYTGLTQAQLASKSFEEIQAILTKQSKGAGKIAIDTYAGSVDKLSIAADNAKESIGKGLVDLFAALAGNGNIDEATANINTFSDALGQMLSDASKYGALDWLSAFVTGNVTEGTASKLVKRPSARRFFTGGSGVSSDLLAARKAAAAEAARLKAIKDAAAAKIKADKLAAANKAKLEKASAVFDLQKISIAAALKGKISEEEKTRLLLMQAIANEDANKAEALSKKLEEIQKKNEAIAKSLTEISTVTNPFEAWATSLSAAAAVLGAMPALIDATGALTPRGQHNVPQGGDLPGGQNSIFTPDMTPAEIADTATAAADMAVAAADAAAAAVAASEPVVAAIIAAADAATGISDVAAAVAEVVTNTGTTATGSSSMYNPYGYSSNVAGMGIPYPTTNVYVTNTGSVIMQDDFVTAVNEAMVLSNQNGYNNYRPGAIVTNG